MIDERAYAKAVGETVNTVTETPTVQRVYPIGSVPVYGEKEHPAYSYGVSPWSGKELGNTLEGEVERRRCRRDYGEYVRVSNDGFYMTHMHRYVCDCIQAFIEAKTDKALDILLLSIPPRSGKSYTITETLPSWFLGKNPTGNVIICGYEGTFAEGFSRRNRDKFNRYAKDIFRVEENPNIQGVAQWETAAGGRCRAAGLKGGITGFGAELFIIDDPIKNQEMAESETVLAKIHDEMGPSVQSRIHPGGKLIVIQTRWVENDVIGYIQSNWSDYVWADINLPCECEDEATDPLHRKLGDSLMGDHMGDFDLPQRIRNDNIWLRSKKMLVCAGEGERVWNALYQGHPSAQNGNLFRDNWWKRYCRKIGGVSEDGCEYGSRIDIADMEYTCLSVDATFKKTETSDRVAITLWGLSQKNAYLYKLINKRMGFTETVERIRRLCSEYPGIDQLIIEDKANGSAIIDTLKYTDGIPPIVAVNPLGGKYSRAQAVSPFIAGGSVYIPVDFTESERREIEDDNHIETGYGRFLYQMSHFPFAKNDDMVDSMSQALSRLIKIVTGEDPAPEKRWTRFTKWYPDMWEDFEQMNSMEQEEFIRTYGAPLEWEDS